MKLNEVLFWFAGEICCDMVYNLNIYIIFLNLTSFYYRLDLLIGFFILNLLSVLPFLFHSHLSNTFQNAF